MLKRVLFVGCLLSIACTCAASDRHALAPVPAEIASTHFTVTINGRPTPVDHAALNLYFLNFEARKHTRITVTAPTDDFWAKGVEVQPWSLNIRPKRSGRTISFTLDGPAKLSISRPADFLADADMLYLFANPPEHRSPTASTPGVRYYGPGAHHENIDAHTGDIIYLAPGAVIFGALNLWQVDHVKVRGRGVIVYDGPQPTSADNGWMHKRNWHCIVMDNAHDIEIEGITCVVRSRTWQIQMKDSRGILFDNVKVIGANSGNANADGIDWLGGGDTVVRNSFFRAADDIFAMQSSWEGYGPKAFAVQGKPVTNITVENSVLSTSVSNVVRAGWPEKNFQGGNFTLRNSDVLHMGLGGCGVPFSLLEIWADRKGRGESAGFHFNNVRMDDWYSLALLEEPVPGIRDVSFTDIMGLETPSLVPSTLKGDVSGVAFDNVVTASNLARNDADIPINIEDGAQRPIFHNTGPSAHIVATRGLVRPGDQVHFEAVPDGGPSAHLHYTWLFGDGTQKDGRKVKHRFPDTQGTLRDGSGRFRVLLHISADGATDEATRNTWLYQPIVVASSLRPALLPVNTLPGLIYHLSGAGAAAALTPASTAIAPTFSLAGIEHHAKNYSVSFEGDIAVPDDGEYTVLVIANDRATIELDGQQLAASPRPFAQLCGLAGNAARPISVSVALAKGRHHLRISETHTTGVDNFKVLWQGPHPLAPIPASVLSH